MVVIVVHVILKSKKGLFWSSFHFQDLPCANKINGVGSFGRLRTGIEQYNRMILFILGLVYQETVEFDGKSKKMAEIERTKIQEKVPIDEFFVNIEAFDGYLFLL